jgi:multicomponent K+:H+ antiporter subunit F
MMTFALYVTAASVIVAMAMNMVRLLRGPHDEDRVLAVDTLYLNSIALIVLLGTAFGSAMYFEIALLIAMMGFVSTVALAKYLDRGNLMD